MDIPWTVRVERRVNRELKQLPDAVRREAIRTIADLAEDPFPTWRRQAPE